MRDALTIDLEEWYHPYEIQRSGVAYDANVRQAPAATIPLLDLLRRYSAHATFFTVGEVAQAHPDLIARMLNEGHELAFHGWTHQALWQLSRETFAAEIERFLAWRDANFPGVPVRGYRAPTFSLDAQTAWAVDVLRDYGFAYDASIFPARTTLYGVPEAPQAPYFIRAEALTGAEDGLREIPMSVFSAGGLR
ncbi:MAG: polysaccharide deacetylase family protein, partial [Anaerolineales bacterium]